MFGLSKLVTTIIGGLALVVLVLAILWLDGCEKRRSMGAQQRVEQGQAGAASNSARDAVTTQGQVNANEQASADLGRSNEKEIRDAEGSDQPVSNAANVAGRASLCRRAAYRNRPECRVFFSPTQ